MARCLVRAFTLAGALTSLLLVVVSLPATASFIDIVVVGTWESANVSPVINKLGFVDGDRFVMKATYDDTTLFNGSEGVTATIDPTVNAGTSFNVIVPHAAGAPNPLLFDHADHTPIGFAPNAQIEFDGTDATTDPGVYRNFEIHVDFTFAGDLHDFDTFKGPIQTETDMFNESQGYNLAAVGAGVDHLLVVTNDMTANPGGPYVFSAGSLSLNTNGSSGGGSGFPVVFDWTGPGGTLANSPGAAIAFGLAESGLLNTADASSISLVATEAYTDFASASAAASVSYANGPPTVLTAMGTNEVDSSITFSATFDDADLVANGLVPGFEVVTLEFLYNDAVFLEGGGNVLPASLVSIFGGPGVFGVVARATDLAGLAHSLPFDVNVMVCVVDGDCDDGEFCTGVEMCVANACGPGPGDPCSEPTPFCDEVGDVCLECLVADDCDDGAFCTGTETCDAGTCNSSGDPCSAPTPVCEEVTNMCVEVGIASVPASSPAARVLLALALFAAVCAAPWLTRRAR